MAMVGTHTSPETALRALFDVAVATADPMRSVPQALPTKPKGRVVVIGAGKASARMAEAVEAAWGPCDGGACEGLVITRYGYARPCQSIDIIEAAHPVPDAAGFDATVRLLDLVGSLGADDFVLALISGGASALLTAPIEGVSLADKQAVNAALLASGAPIDQMNIVRKQLSRVKGGRLAAAAYPAKMLSLLISDVPGDDPAYIGSGPTVGDAATPGDAKAILEQWQIPVSSAVLSALDRSEGSIPPAHEALSRVENRVIIAPSQSLAAAQKHAEAAGCHVEILGDAIEGEAREVAQAHAELAKARKSARLPIDPPLVLLSGGELTVTRRGNGSGGPNAEYALALALALDGEAGISAIACDTDGVDGAADVAGAIISSATLEKAAAANVSAQAALANNDAHSFFGALQDQVVTGPTLTNVNDFRAIWIG